MPPVCYSTRRRRCYGFDAASVGSSFPAGYQLLCGLLRGKYNRPQIAVPDRTPADSTCLSLNAACPRLGTLMSPCPGLAPTQRIINKSSADKPTAVYDNKFTAMPSRSLRQQRRRSRPSCNGLVVHGRVCSETTQTLPSAIPACANCLNGGQLTQETPPRHQRDDSEDNGATW
ncbi:hypothetical protein LSAT2_005803 [Lamellibrachia satsuma]|nr:hypothetical protein LSAT2_005803 [Lamellibrachia satsuma]